MNFDKYVKITYSNLEIQVTSRAKSQLKKHPHYIQRKFDYWCDLIGSVGLRESRKFKGFHDEPLQGKRRGQRSVRLSRAYRLIYIPKAKKSLTIIEVLEVNKHDY